MSLKRHLILTAVAGWMLGATAMPSPAEPPLRAADPDSDHQPVRQWDAAKKQDLQEKQERFYRMSEAERERLRRMHEELTRADQGERLRHVLHSYTHWLHTLSMYERAELLSLPPEQRIKRIEQIMERQADHRLRSFLPEDLTDDDLKVLGEWMEEFFRQRNEQIKQVLPWIDTPLAAGDEFRRRQAIMFFLMRMGKEDWPKALQPSEEDVQGLKSRLSPKPLKQLEAAQRAGKLQPLVMQWMRAVVFSRWRPTEVEEAELQRFYREELSGEQRGYIDSLPPDRMRYKLLHGYEAWKDGRLEDDRWLFDRFGDYRRGGGRPPGSGRPGGGFGGGSRRPPSRDLGPARGQRGLNGAERPDEDVREPEE
jgi:hypothetical protein